MSIKDKLDLRTEMRDYLLHKAWPYGYVCEKSFHGRVLSYLTKYCCKPELIGDFHKMKPFTLISQGIGLNLLSTLGEARIEQMKQSLDFTLLYNGSKIKLPRYYVQKIAPHSLQDLRSAVFTDEYPTILERRRRLSLMQMDISFNHQLKIQNEFGSYASYRAALKSKRDYAYDEFKSKIKKRKNF